MEKFEISNSLGNVLTTENTTSDKHRKRSSLNSALNSPQGTSMSFIDAIKTGRTPVVTPEIAIIMIILNIFPLSGLGTLIAGFAAEGKDKDFIIIGIIQLILDIPFFLILLPFVIIPFIGQVIYMAGMACYGLIRVCNIIFGVYMGIKTYMEVADEAPVFVANPIIPVVATVPVTAQDDCQPSALPANNM
ncbi:hypothetical protein J8273_2534 [Carpediemonas membranifera]|uniref:Uncharacterized protein n=1 Tax=Carpediemonas membranifera TaxID=201153 RepID=A0A8J6BAI8_9EUKA|nr:hypothetical protein J8273_2534 [Carpediemonas membranifera]|eukprot:KAG9396182.1 hypothetical protein J8273_2534 [Carpediemonas membranifera]